MNRKKSIVLDTWPISKIKKYGLNAKLHPQEQVDKIAVSIEKFGFNDPIGINYAGVIVEGHGRYLAAKKLGLSEVPVIVLHGLSKKEERLYRITHNKLTQQTGFDRNLLLDQLRTVFDDDLTKCNFSEMGFDNAAVTAMLAADNVAGDQQATIAATHEKPLPVGGYEIIFDDKEQQSTFQRFLRALKTEDNKDNLSGSRMIDYIRKSGVLKRVTRTRVRKR